MVGLKSCFGSKTRAWRLHNMTNLQRYISVLAVHPFKRAARLIKRRSIMILQKAYLAVALIMLVSFVASLASSLTPNTTISALLSNQSWDLEAMVQKASDTRPWNDNGARSYGPLTYRLTNLGASFAPYVGMPDVAFFEHNATEPAHHFFLTMVAGLSALVVGWVIGCALTSNPASRLVSAVVFGSALLQTKPWRHELFVGHPDVVMAPLAAGLAYFLLKGAIEGQRVANISPVSVMLGLGMATKVSFIYFLPPIIGAYLSPNSLRTILRLGFIAALAFLVYIAVGFPQSLFIHEVIGAMLDQKQVLAPVNAESILRWIWMFFDVFAHLAGVMLLLSVTIADRPLIASISQASRRKIIGFGILASLPALTVICTMNFIPSFVNSTEHYSISFSAYTVVGMALGMACLVYKVLGLLPHKIERTRKLLGPFALVIAVYTSGLASPAYINETAKENLKGRSEQIQLIEKINFLSNTGAVPLITPYFPNFQLPQQEGLGKERLEKEAASTLGIKNGIFLMIDWGWYSRFLEDEPNQYDLIDGYENWLENRQLYTELFETGTMSGISFELIYHQGSSQIWATDHLAKAYRQKSWR